MENVAPVRALVRRSQELLQLGFVVLAVGIFLAVIGLVMTTILLIPKENQLFSLYNFFGNLIFGLGVIVAAVGVAMAIRAVTRRRENDLAMETGEFLSRYFDNTYVFIRNINRSGLGYIDGVLLGPAGALVFRILDNEGAFANEGSGWLVQDHNREWVPFRFNPTKQTVDDVQHLRHYLTKNNLGDVPVFGVIVFTRDESHVSVVQKTPIVPIAHLTSLVDVLKDSYLAQTDRITVQTVGLLRRLLLE
jgi:hypothetical protein